MNWQCVRIDRGLGSYRGEWDALNMRYYGGHPFRDSCFMEPLLKQFGTGQEHLFIHRSDGELDGMVILGPRRLGIWQQFSPPQLQSGPLLIKHAEDMQDLFMALPPMAWAVELINQDPLYSPPGLFNKAPTKLIRPHVLTINVSLDGDFNTYWNNRSRNLVKNIRRYLNRIDSESASPEHRILTESGSMASAVERYGELESNGWKQKIGTAININNKQGQFYSEVMSGFAGKGQAQVFEYFLDKQLAASRLVISGGGMSIILKTTYNEFFSRFAPGRLLLRDLLENAFRSKQQDVIEFYTNASEDQLAWSTGKRVISHITIFRKPWLATLYRMYQKIKNVGTPQTVNSGKNEVIVTEKIDGLPKQSEELFAQAEQDSFDLGAHWFQLLIDTALPVGMRPCFLALASNNEIRCILQLMAGPHRLTSLTTFYTSIYRPLLAPGVQPEELAILVRRAMKNADASFMRLDFMDPLHPSFDCTLEALRCAGLRATTFFSFGNWYLPTQGRSFATYFGGLSSQLRNTVRRREKKFLSSGGRLVLVSGEKGLEEAILSWGRIYQSSWKVPEPYPNFVPEFMRLCARQGWLRMGLAYIGNVPIAAQIWIVNQGRAAIYKMAYDGSYAQYSAGTLLTAKLMECVFDIDKVVEVDYLVGDDAYKKDWMSHRRERRGIVAFDLQSPRGLAGYVVQLLGDLRHRIGTKRATPIGKHISYARHGEKKWHMYSVGEIEQLAPIWDNLNQRVGGSPLLTSNYLRTALKCFGSGNERLVCYGNPRAPDCMAVLARRKGVVWETFQPSQAPIGFWLMRPGLDLEVAVGELLKALPGLPMMVGITQQDPEILARPQDSMHVQTLNYINTARILVEGDFETYWGARGKNLRQNMRKARSKLDKAGHHLRLVCITDPASIESFVREYGLLESAGWKAKDGTAVSLDNIQGQFYKKLMEEYCAAGKGRIYQLMFDDHVVAMDLCVANQDVIVILKTTYAEAFSEYSPAMLMHQELFKALFDERKFRRIEFYGKYMDWHQRFTEDIRGMYHINFFRLGQLKRKPKQPSIPASSQPD